MNADLTFWQKLMADLGRPNDNGGSNYSDAEMHYYLRDVLGGYDDFIPTPVLRDAWRGARVREAQPRGGIPSQDNLNRFLREALNARLDMRNAPEGTLTPTGADAQQMWNSPLSQTDAILKQIKLRAQQEAQRDYYPPEAY